jgi:hypothetical protein
MGGGEAERVYLGSSMAYGLGNTAYMATTAEMRPRLMMRARIQRYLARRLPAHASLATSPLVLGTIEDSDDAGVRVTRNARGFPGH